MNRIPYCLLICAALGANLIFAADNSRKPNIVIVITDDQGYGDLGSRGNPIIKTPNLDKLHDEAIRLTNFHVSTTCAPSRGALMTGRHTNRLNVFHTISGRSLLFEDELLLPEVLADNGYVNGMFGKWHLGDNYPFRPGDRGFHEVVRHGGGGITQGPDYWGNDYFDDTYWHNGEMKSYEGYCTDVFFDEALRFIETNSDQPFFCYIATNAPHAPYNVPEEYLNIYKDVPDLPERFQRFYGMITNIDDNVKRLESKLSELGLRDNTIFIFMTDNGTAGGNQIFDGGLRGGKGSEYEGGHRVPFFLRWPDGDLGGGKDIDTLLAHYDVLPTFVDLLDLDFTARKPLDGMSFVPLLTQKNPTWPNRILYMDTQRLQNLIKYQKYTVMDQDWRLVNGNELYNVTEDLGQENNVIEQYPEVTQRLAAGYERWWQSFMDEGVSERYAYIKVGTEHENPSRISSHDMLTGKHGHAWHQYGAANASQATGRWKIEFVEDGEYRIFLRRFPRESGLAINAVFPAQDKQLELERTFPASTKDDFTQAYLYVANLSGSQKIGAGQAEVVFQQFIPAGKYDMEAQLIDQDGRVHPAYYVYIEKLDGDHDDFEGVVVTNPSFGKTGTSAYTPEIRASMKELYEDKFGLFVHFGPYAQLEGMWDGNEVTAEWIMNRANIPIKDYEKHAASKFMPDKFNAKQWVDIAESAGMRFIVVTSKHHDGFAMYDSAHPYNLVDFAGFGRDLLKELSDECARRDMNLGFYYSQSQDWHEKGAHGNSWDFPANQPQELFDAYFQEKAVPQVEELTTNYGDIFMIWFDTPVKMDDDKCEQMMDIVRKNQPGALVNSRLGQGYGHFDVALDNGNTPSVSTATWLPDLKIPWQTHQSVTEGGWGYTSFGGEHDRSDEYTDFVYSLCRIVCYGGVYLLNVGPRPDGTVPESQVKSIQAIGEWLEVNGESIYGADPSPLKFPPFAITSKPGKLYLHLKDLDQETVRLDGILTKVTNAYCLADPRQKSLTFSQDGARLEIYVPNQLRQPRITVVVLDIAGEYARVVDETLRQDNSGVIKLPVAKCEFTTRRIGYDYEHEVTHRWGEHPAQGLVWTVNVTEPGIFTVVSEDNGSDDYIYRLITNDSELELDSAGETEEITHKRHAGTIRIDAPGIQKIAVYPKNAFRSSRYHFKGLQLIPVK